MPNKYLEIKDLQLVFGKGKALKKAINLLEDEATNEEIRKKTKCAVGVRHVNFDIKQGELFVVVGLSGSGKSSLIRCFNLLNTPTKGEIILEGTDITKLNKEDLLNLRRNKVSMVFQSFGLLDHRSVLRNVEYGLEVKGVDKEERMQKSLEAIEVVGLKGWEHYHPHQLSGGMKQRVGLARAIANDPEILLMDEPYSALDPLIRRDMQNELLNLEDYIDKTIIFITHDMNEAFKLGDRIALMKDGEIVQLGKPMDFFNNPANSYVEDFIADVDKTQVLKAKQVMDDLDEVFTIDESRTKVIKYLEDNELDFTYVVDEKGVYKGYVTLEDLKGSRVHTIGKLLKTDVTPFYRQDYIKDVIPLLAETDYAVPIVDSKNKLRGTIASETIINELV
jgi:glycine betaine/proline transport system ATP-binding protein